MSRDRALEYAHTCISNIHSARDRLRALESALGLGTHAWIMLAQERSRQNSDIALCRLQVWSINLNLVTGVLTLMGAMNPERLSSRAR